MSKKLIISVWGILTVCFLSVDQIPAGASAPSDFLPLGVHNHWRFFTSYDSPDYDDRWTFVDIVRGSELDAPDETISFETVFSEHGFDGPDTSAYRIQYWTLSESNADLCVSGLIYEDSLIVLDPLWTYLRNPITWDDTTSFHTTIDGVDYDIYTVVKSDTASINVPSYGQFDDCLHLQEAVYFDDVLREIRDEYFVSLDYLDSHGVAGYAKRIVERWVMPDTSIISQSRLEYCDLVDPAAVEFPRREGDDRLELSFHNLAGGNLAMRYHLPSSDWVSLVIYDIRGRRMASVVDGHRASGTHQDLLDTARFPAGIFFGSLRAGGMKATARFLVVR